VVPVEMPAAAVVPVDTVRLILFQSVQVLQ
jgi:hypothetical protein